MWAEIDALPASTDPEVALGEGAELIFPEHGSNEASFIPDKSRVDLEAVSDVVVRGRYVNQRMAVVPMEPDSCAAAPADDGRITVWPSTQMPHMLSGQLAGALGWKRRDLHIITPQVGGGFGGKAGVHPEYVVVTKAARALNRPIVWVPSRSEDMRSLPHSRGQVQYAELGCKARRNVHRLAGAADRRRRRLSGHRRVPARGYEAHVARHLQVPRHPVRRRRRRHQHHAHGRLPRRRAT